MIERDRERNERWKELLVYLVALPDFQVGELTEIECVCVWKIDSCCCCLPCNHCSNGHTWVVEESLAFLVIDCVLRTAGSSCM